MPGAENAGEVDSHRNCAIGKAVLTEDGLLRIDILRDWQGSYEPFYPKNERRFTGIDNKIVATTMAGYFLKFEFGNSQV